MGALGKSSKSVLSPIIIPNRKFDSSEYIIFSVAFTHNPLIAFGFIYCASGISLKFKTLQESFNFSIMHLFIGDYSRNSGGGGEKEESGEKRLSLFSF